MQAACALRFYFDFSCPYAYVASTLVESMADRCAVALDARPMLLGGVFRAVQTPQNLSATLSPAKARHNLADMLRQANLAGVPLHMPPRHPMRTVEALRALLVVGPPYMPLAHHFFHAYWVDGIEISSPDGLREVMRRAGLEDRSAEILAAIESDAIKDELRSRTDEAIAAGVFGVPTFLVRAADGDEQLYWGVDRMDMVEAKLGGPGLDRPIPPLRRPIDLYFDYSSPFAYLGCHRAEQLLADADPSLVRWRPMLLGAVFKQVGTADVPMFTQNPAKRRHTGLDLERQAASYGAPFRFPSRFPMRSVLALRATLAAGAHQATTAEGRGLIHALFRGYWAEDRDIADPQVVAAIADACGHDGQALIADAEQASTKHALRESTDAAVAAGVFGAPTFVVHGEGGPQLFWGADRLELALRAGGD